MKMLLLFLLIGLYSFGQNKPKVIHHKKIDTKIEYRTVSDSDTIEVTPPAPPPEVEITPPVIEDIVEEENKDYPPPPDVTPPYPPPIADETVIEVQEEVVEFPDVEAEFPCHIFYSYDTLGNVVGQDELCGARGMMKWIGKNVVYPQASIEMNEQGRVFLSFVVEKDGSISNVKIERGISRDLDREAKRVIQKMPKWTPGVSAGKPIRCRARLPINFRLN